MLPSSPAHRAYRPTAQNIDQQRLPSMNGFFSGHSLSKYEYQIITVKMQAQVEIAIDALGLPVLIVSWGCFLLPRDIFLPFYTADSKMSPSLNA